MERFLGIYHGGYFDLLLTVSESLVVNQQRLIKFWLPSSPSDSVKYLNHFDMVFQIKGWVNGLSS